MAVPALVLLLGIAALGVRLSQEEKTSRNFVVHTDKTIGAADKILSDMESTERLERGFQLQGGQVTPTGIYASLKEMPGDLKRFEALTADNPEQRARAQKLEALLGVWERDIAEEIEITRATQPANVPETASAARLSWLMSDALTKVDQIHAILQEAKAEENRLLARGMTKTRGYERSTLMTALLGALFVLVTLGAAAALLLRSNTRLMQAGVARAREAALLRSALDSVRDGAAIFNADMTLAAFNRAFFVLADLPPSLAEIGTPLERFREAEAGRSEKVFPEKLLGREVHQVVVSGRRLEIQTTAMPNEGAFVVVADLSGRQQGGMMEMGASGSNPGKGPRKALVVDDMALVRLSTADMIGEMGLAAAEAGNGQDALEILAKDKEIDVLVTDLGLPGMTGAELIREARRRNPSLTVVIVSGYSRNAENCADVPADAVFLMKPFDTAQLRRAIFRN